MMKQVLGVACLAAIAVPASANDTTAVLGTGGLTFVRSDAIQMQSEDLFISPDEIRVAYRFRNQTDKEVASIVAFPMPDIAADPYSNVGLPDFTKDNFLDFTVEADGKAIEPALEQRAFAADLDVTDELRKAGLPLFPYSEGIEDAIAALPQATRDDWVSRGIASEEAYIENEKEMVTYTPRWRLKSTYWWRMEFPAGKPIEVKHRYRPSVGGTVAVTFMDGKVARGGSLAEYKAKYCMDDAFVRAVERAAGENPEGFAPFFENWISYVLTTGGNWLGSIDRFTLTIDKGQASSLISFCGEGVKKIGPTTFRMEKTDFFPERDIDILLLNRPEDLR